MSEMKVYYLGVGSATPSLVHQPSCQVVDFRGRLFVIDCGEGAQLAMRRMGIKFSRIERIFISHLHGDHFFGLPGLLSTLSLHNIGGEITVHIPEQGVDWLKDTMQRFSKDTSFQLNIEPIAPQGGTVYADKALTVEAFPLSHRIPCTGFLFRTAPGLLHLRKDMVEWLQIPIKMRQAIKVGADYMTPDGKTYENERLTTPGTPSTSYAYCSDTIFDPSVVPYIKPADTLYHEATYLEEKSAKAAERYHSTAAQAVRIAAMAEARRLVLGHYSKSYPDLTGHLDEAVREAEAIGYHGEIIASNEGMVLEC